MKTWRLQEWWSLPRETQELIENVQHEQDEVPLGRLAKRLGVSVKVAILPSYVSGDIRCNDDHFVIRVNRNEPRYRQRFTIAHELAHFLLHRDLIGDGITDSPMYRSSLSNEKEVEANRLAAEIVAPVSTIKKILNGRSYSDDVINEVACSLGVSRRVIEIRLGVTNTTHRI